MWPTEHFGQSDDRWALSVHTDVMRMRSASGLAETTFAELPRAEQAKLVGLAAATVGVTAFWSLLLMAPDSTTTPPATTPIVQQAPSHLDAQPR